MTALGPNTPARLSRIDIASGNEKVLLTGFALINPMMTSDGSTVMFTDVLRDGQTSQLYTVGIDGANLRQVTTQGPPTAGGTISGDGSVVFSVTGGRLVRVNVASGASTELLLLPPLITAAYLGYQTTTIAPIGSIIALYGSGLSNAQQVSFCGRPLAITSQMLFASFQVPWDLPDGSCQAVVQSDSPFEHGIDLDVEQYDPQYFGAASSTFIHEGFTGFVTIENPARTGEVITTYMMGLGPVDENGMLRSGFQCLFGATPGDLLYAALAPEAGFYQVNIRVPAPQTFSTAVFCGWDVTSRAVADIWIEP
jgi:uncharacterized protein (TIGR03437 family)